MKKNILIYWMIMLALYISVSLSCRAQSETGTNSSTSSADPTRAAYQSAYRLEKQIKYDDAIKALKAVANSYTLDMRLGWLYYLNRDYISSQTHYQNAIKNSPNSLEAKLGCLLTLLAEKRYAEAETTARQVMHVDSNNYYANLRLSYALRYQLKFEQADEIASHMSNLYPTDAYFLSELALAKIGLKQQAAAKKIFNEIRLQEPDNTQPKEEMSYLKAY